MPPPPRRPALARFPPLAPCSAPLVALSPRRFLPWGSGWERRERVEGGFPSLSYSVTEFRLPGHLASTSPSLFPRGVFRPQHMEGLEEQKSPHHPRRPRGSWAPSPQALPHRPPPLAPEVEARGRGRGGRRGPSWVASARPGLRPGQGWQSSPGPSPKRGGLLPGAGRVGGAPPVSEEGPTGGFRKKFCPGLLSPLLQWCLSFSSECGGCGDLESIKMPWRT